MSEFLDDFRGMEDEEDNYLEQVSREIKEREAEWEAYRIEMTPKVLAYSNNYLFYRYGDLTAGNSWEGERTWREQIEYELIEPELYNRLRDCGFLIKEEE